MAFEEGDITVLRRDATQELGQDDLVDEPDSARPPAVPLGGATDAPRSQASSKVDRARRARDWLEECERELRDQPDVRRAARLYFEMARTCEGPLKDTRRALQYYQATLERTPDARRACTSRWRAPAKGHSKTRGARFSTTKRRSSGRPTTSRRFAPPAGSC